MQMGEAKFWEHTHTVKFPKVTMCDLTVRRLGNVQRYTVQCVLPVNIFTEKIYLFIYFWFILISFLNIVSLVLWVGELTLRCDRQRYVSSHLRRMERLHAGDKSLGKRFVKYLQRDGIFVMFLVEHNTNAVFAGEVLAALWDYYRAKSVIEELRNETDEESDIVSDIVS